MTVRPKDLLVVLFVESVTFAVKENVPVWVVVPVNWPALVSAKPWGNDPDARLHW